MFRSEELHGAVGVRKRRGRREAERTMCGAEMVASWPIDLMCVCVKVKHGNKMAQQTRTGANLHKRTVYRAHN